MTRVLEVAPEDRFIRVEAGRTNLSVSQAVETWGSSMRPTRQASSPARLRQCGDDSGGAHCLKYGVTTNNLLGVTLVLMDGRVVTLGGPWLDAGGIDLLGVVCGSEGQLGGRDRGHPAHLAPPRGRTPVMLGYASSGRSRGLLWQM